MTDKKYCHEVIGVMDLYIHDELDSYGKEKIEDHISTCDECRLLLEDESAVVRAVKKFGDETPDVASAVMNRILDGKITVDKPKRRFSFAPSLIPAAVAVIAVTLFSRTNIMKMMEKNFDSSNSAGEVYDEGQAYAGTDNTEIPNWAALKFDESGEAESYADPPQEENETKTAVDNGGTGGEVTEDAAIPEQRSLLFAPEDEDVGETSVDIQDITDEYDPEIFNEVNEKLNSVGDAEEDAINTLIVLNSADKELLAELLQDIEYEEINGVITADISAFERFRLNSNDNNYDDFKIYQENTESTILAFTFGE